MADLTAKQEARLDRFVVQLADWGVEAATRNDLTIVKMEETRAGRGHDLQVTYVDGDHVAYVHIDPYGNGAEGWGTVDWVHNSADDDCLCDECERDRRED